MVASWEDSGRLGIVFGGIDGLIYRYFGSLFAGYSVLKETCKGLSEF
jgi:hypothetical protein